jgi:para-nitrobenzyl esterase
VVGRRGFVLGGTIAAVFAAAGGGAADSSPIVRIRDGLVRGRITNGVRAFTGIPYAEPPAGPLRFSPPRPARSWSGELDATHPARVPPQDIDPALPPAMPISEDCLQLNVWTPQAPGPHPVFVWIYGGGNASGSISLPAYQGESFARDGVVCVSCNYRLGVLGFLELGEITGPEDAGSGNNALRDQVLVLEWVRDNIAAFGGDPLNLTVGGQSAGAWNCATLMALPAANGLFRRTILASGGADTAYTPDRATEFAERFVARLGGKQRLRKASIAELLTAQKAAQADSTDLMVFRPVIDGTYLPATPIELLRRGSARSVTTMVGHTHDEIRYLLTPAQAESPASEKLLRHVDPSTLPSIISAYARAFPDATRGERMLRIFSADLVGIPSLRIAEAQASLGAKVYYYQLSYAIRGGPFGAYSAHGIDVPLIFERVDTDFARNVFGYTAADLPMAKRVHDTWISFIKTGNPGEALSTWPPYDLAHRYTMTIAASSQVSVDPEGTERAIWEGVI